MTIINLTKHLPIRVVVFASGYGSNFQKMIDKFKDSKKVKIVGLITDNSGAYAIQRAIDNNIPYDVVRKNDYKNRVEFDEAILKRLEKYKPDLIVLAGYLKVIKNPKFFKKYLYRIINIHPALLPAFKGTIHAQEEAFDYGVKVSGITIHFVTEDVDGGPIILQKCVDISKCKNPDKVREKISRYEHKYFPQVVEMFATGIFEIEGKRVKWVEKK